MTNFSSFFPVAGAGGGGGFTKMNKYSTYRALNDATHKGTIGSVNFIAYSNNAVGSTSIYGYYNPQNADTYSDDYFVGYTFTRGGTTHTVTASNFQGGSPASAVTLTFTPALTSTFNFNNSETLSTTDFGITVNPATDLGLEDGASLGYFMIGGGQKTSQSNVGGYGGNIIQGTAIITTASTNLVLTVGQGLLGGLYGASTGTNSTITGGLTITTANGTNHIGFPGLQNPSSAPGQGINGYGTGALGYNDADEVGQNTPHHGFGTAVTKTAADYGSDGAILLFY